MYKSINAAIVLLLSFLYSVITELPCRAASPPNPNDLRGKLIVGYQGWFGCPGDDSKNKSWEHWSFKSPDKENLIVDMLPATDEYDETDLYPTDMIRPDGSKVCLFSSLSPNVVKKHFQWMADYDIDGAAIQRFVAEIADPLARARRDKVLINARAAAEATGRVFYVTYDVSSTDEKIVYQEIENDWQHLVKDLHITASPNYLRHHGKPVLQLWGFGFDGRPGSPEPVYRLISRLKSGTADLLPVTLIGGVPTCWRTLIGDSKRDPGWARVYRSYDVISPWLTNRFDNRLSASVIYRFIVCPDISETRQLGIDYMPVIFPGFSWYNLMHCNNRSDKAIFNRVPRRDGEFYWMQICELLAMHSNMLYAGMFDEMNEGTALFKVETSPQRIPAGAHILYPKLDGCDIPPDYFLRITGLANEFLRNGTVPPRHLSDLFKSKFPKVSASK